MSFWDAYAEQAMQGESTEAWGIGIGIGLVLLALFLAVEWVRHRK